MKIVRIFGIVLALHVVMLLVFFQPGCQSKPRPQPEQTGAKTSSTGPSENLDWESPDYTTQVEPLERQRTSPTRPSADSSRSRMPVEEPLQPLQPLPSTSPSPSISAPREPSSSGVYTVQRGDNLSAIAKRHNVSLNSLLSINGLNKSSIIRPGQELLIPAGGSARSTAGASSSAPVAPAGTETYTVVRGDSLSRIASRHGTTVDELKELNNLTNDTIRVDQKLIVPRSSGGSASRSGSSSTSHTSTSSRSTASTASTASGDEHVVKSGETPGGIASRYGISVDELMSANNMSDPRRMQIGQKLVIPGKKTETASSTTATSASRPAPRQPAPTAPAPAPEPAPAPRPRDPVLDPRPVQVLPSDEISEDEFPIIPVLPEN